MAEFKELRNVSKNFENAIRKVSSELFSANIDESFEDVIEKELRDLALSNSKFRLLQAISISVTPEITEIEKNVHTTVNDYEEAVNWKIIEQQIVKTLTQTNAVKKLVTSSSCNLDPELAERKDKIMEQLTKYRQAESQLRELESILKEKEERLFQTRQEWDRTLTMLREREKAPHDTEQVNGPLYKKLLVLTGKIELMQWLIAKLVTSRSHGYDWLSDPHKRLNALAMARRVQSPRDYLES